MAVKAKRSTSKKKKVPFPPPPLTVPARIRAIGKAATLQQQAVAMLLGISGASLSEFLKGRRAMMRQALRTLELLEWCIELQGIDEVTARFLPGINIGQYYCRDSVRPWNYSWYNVKGGSN